MEMRCFVINNIYLTDIAANGNTVTIVLVNEGLDMTDIQKLKNVNIVEWSDNSIELLTNIRKNMRCGGGEPVYRPCKGWFSFVPDSSNTLSEADYNTQIAFVKNEIGRMNRPDKIQLIESYIDGHERNDWNSIWNIENIQEDTDYCRIADVTFKLNITLQRLSNCYYRKNRAKYQSPYVALVFISTTESYENYGGADDVVKKLKDAGYQLTFILMGPNVNETKLTNYTTNFVYWSDMSNPEPDNWDQVRLQVYGCNRTTEF
ncbi:hypothetical protein FO519_009928 [Halicephalobus sp. NKZ332]|nr:hypothetical protein FO519_009928 [Halicephalobus sp. NKZ332]